ncbi:MAG: hypothetical protein M0R46_03935 [Candidatus Muirbacterium halophilum]|nr:hypothetical protein [Candidatus Muirbacterium halophilum]MCK9475042.1 hypothetical protein [Candidatus Muirbacterium halophilum]
MISFVLRKNRKENYFLLKIICSSEEQIKVVEASSDTIVSFYPGDFPETHYFVNIINEKSDIEELIILIKLKDERVFSLSLFIKDNLINFKDFKIEDIKNTIISNNELKARKKLAVELFLSDEGLMGELMDVSENPEEDMSYGELECEKIGQNTLYLDEESAINYINYNVVKAPDSVWRRILDKY